MADLQAELNRLAGTTGLDAQGAANAGAGTTGLDLVGAINAWAGTDDLELNAALQSLATLVGGNATRDGNAALSGAPGEILAAASWRISASENSDAEDLTSGGNDAVSTPAVAAETCGPTFVDPEVDGQAVAIYHTTSTGVGDGFTTPDSAALSITGDLMLRGRWRAIGDPTVGATENRTVCVMKTLDTDDDNPDYPSYELSLLLTGEPNVIWHDGTEQKSLGAGVTTFDEFSYNELLVRLDVDNGASGHTAYFYERNDDDADFTLTHDGSGWSLIGTATGEGTTQIGDTTGPLHAAAFKQVCAYAGVYDSIAASAEPVAWFDPVDAGGFHVSGTFVSDLTEETWTANSGPLGIVPVPRRAWVCGLNEDGSQVSRFVVPDDDLIDLADADGTVALALRTSVNEQAGAAYLTKYTGTFGVDAVGFALLDISGLGGFGGAVSSTGVAAATTSMTPGDHVLSMSIDRTADELSVYLNGTLIGTAQDASSVGDLANAADMVVGGGPPSLVYAAAVWDRVLTSAEHAELPDWLD